MQRLNRLPERIDWEKKKKSLKLFDDLAHLVNKGKVATFSKFKAGQVEGEFKKKKILNFMVYEYFDATRKYFKLYLSKVRQMKNN